jgi:ABC-type lipoprotein export system ATPase subunit
VSRRAAERASELGAEVVVEAVGKQFGRVHALRDVDLRVEPGEMLAVAGHSGSGKSTMLNLIGGLDQPTEGRILIDGRAVWEEPQAVRARRELVGFVFQQHLLLHDLDAASNVEVPLIGAGVGRVERRRRALELLDEVGLAQRADHHPSELSGGERQRVAVARALANEPRLLLADEPTGALDSVTSLRVLDLLAEVRARRGMTMIVVSYDPEVGARADRMVYVADGRLTAAELRPAPAAGPRPERAPTPAGEVRPEPGP